MIICTAIFAWILKAKAGLQWEGAGAAYIFALAADTILIAFAIERLTK